MKGLSQIRRQLVDGEYEFSRHAFRRAVERNISEEEIRGAGREAEILEKYLADKYSPSALFLGFTGTGRPLHFQLSLTDVMLVKIITIYEPSPHEWFNYRKRR